MAERRPKPIQERFEAAVEVIKALPQEGPFQPSNTVKLRFYALYKQVKEGPCNKPKPSFWDAVGRAKWEAWSVCGKMSQELAMQMYVEELQQVVETMPHTPEVEQFLRTIGPFYEVPDTEAGKEQQPDHQGGVASSEDEETDAPQSGAGGSEEGGGGSMEVEEEVDSGGSVEGGVVTEERSEENVVGEGLRDEAGGDRDMAAVTSVERADSVEELSQSDSESSEEVFQESYQEFPIPSPSTSSFPVASNGYPPQDSSGREMVTQDQATPTTVPPAASREFHTPRHSQASSRSLQDMPRHDASATVQAANLSQILSQVNNIQSKLQEITNQLSQVSSMAAARPAPHTSTPSPQSSSRQRWLLYAAPVILSWPILIKHLISYLAKKFGNSSLTPEWVWSLVTFLHTASSVAMLVFLSHQIRS